MPKISIIVPVYNVEKYLRPCLDSVLTQTFTKWECILVDDGSTDQSGIICDEYAKKDKRIRVLHKENAGVSSARNLGIENANGEWYLFIDSDDLLYEYALEAFVSRIKAGIDSICGGYIKIDASSGEIITCSSSREYDRLISKEEALIDFYKRTYGDLFNGYLWNRMFKADIIKKNILRFREDIFIKEDGLFLVQFLCRSEGLHAYTSLPVYKYRTNPDGTMGIYSNTFNKKSLSNLYARCYCYREINKVSENKYLIELAKGSVSFMYKRLLVLLFRDKKKDLTNVYRMSAVAFKCVSPYYIIKHYVKDKMRRNRIT